MSHRLILFCARCRQPPPPFFYSFFSSIIDALRFSLCRPRAALPWSKRRREEGKGNKGGTTTADPLAPLGSVFLSQRVCFATAAPPAQTGFKQPPPRTRPFKGPLNVQRLFKLSLVSSVVMVGKYLNSHGEVSFLLQQNIEQPLLLNVVFLI